MSASRIKRRLEWIKHDGGDSLPVGVVEGGRTENGDPTYVARCVANTYHVDRACGGYSLRTLTAAIPYGGGGINTGECDLLVCHDPEILFWCNAESGQVPELAVGIGNDNTEEIYVARTPTDGSVNLSNIRTMGGDRIRIKKGFKGPILGKLHPSHRVTYIAHNRTEYALSKYQVLCAYLPPKPQYSIPSPHVWVSRGECDLQTQGLQGGVSEVGVASYVARAKHNCDVFNVIGYVLASERVCHYSWQGEEHITDSFEVLVPLDQRNFTWVAQAVYDNFPYNAVRVDSNPKNHLSCAIGRTKISNLMSGTTWSRGSIREHISPTYDQRMQIVGGVHGGSKYLYVPYKKSDYLYSEYEVLIAADVPNMLQELCRYVILECVDGVPDRINKLPLSESMKKFCQLVH